jgi:Flp pilus assembly protein protease CpaA
MFEVEFLPAFVVLMTVCIANYTDLRKRIIPNQLTLFSTGFGIAFHAFLGIWYRDFLTAISGALGAAMAFIIGYAIWLTGGWAGGDVKLFAALGALLPGLGRSFSPPYPAPYPLPITILLNSILITVPILLTYAVYCRLRGRGVFYEQVRITELKEGMIPAEMVYEKNGKIGRWSSKFGFKPCYDRLYANPSRAAGLTRYQIGMLKRLVREQRLKNFIRIKKGMPFAPAFGLGVFITVFYGDLYYRLVLTLVGL